MMATVLDDLAREVCAHANGDREATAALLRAARRYRLKLDPANAPGLIKRARERLREPHSLPRFTRGTSARSILKAAVVWSAANRADDFDAVKCALRILADHGFAGDPERLHALIREVRRRRQRGAA